MEKPHRIYGENVAIQPENVRVFYDERAKRLADMPNPYVSVLLGDQDPAHAAEWDRFEKEIILPELGISGENRVLDIGCGIGRWAEAVIPLAGMYCGTDYSPEMVKAARERNRFPGKEPVFKNLSFQETARDMPKEYPAYFDRLIIGGICMYINDEELPGCFEGLLKLLDERCVIYFTETVAAERRLTLDESPSEALRTTYDVIYRTPAEYNKYYMVLLGAGFRIRKQDYLPHLNNERQFSETDRWYTIFER